MANVGGDQRFTEAPRVNSIRGDEQTKSIAVGATRAALIHAAQADFMKATEHRAASALTDLRSVELQNLPRGDICECCRYPFRGPGSQRFPILTSLDELKELGLGFPLFFLMIKVLALLLGVVFCVASLPNLVQNLYADRQDEWGPKSKIAATSVGGNGDGDSDLSYWPVILNLIALVLLSACHALAWCYFRRRAKTWNEIMETPSDFTVVIKNLGENWKEDELKGHILTKMKTREDFEVVDINVAVAVEELKKLEDVLININIRHELTKANEGVLLPEERPFRRCCRHKEPRNSHTAFVTEDRYREMVALCESQWQEAGQGRRNAGIAFVSMQTARQATNFLKVWKRGVVKRILGSCIRDNRRFKGQSIVVKRAPEPTDIIWENLGCSNLERILRKFATTLVLAVILLCSFAILYGLASWQNDLKDEEKDSGDGKSSVEFSSIPSAAIIYIFNIVLNVTVRVLSAYERRHTFTDLSLSIAFKLTVVLSVNTLLFPILVHQDSSEWYIAGGLANNIFWVALSAAFVKPMFKLCGPMLIWRTCRKREVRKIIEKREKERTAYVSQAKANSIFQYPEADLASWYSEPVIKFLLTLAYTPLLPLIVPITLLGFLLEYWVDKFYLLRLSGKPKQMNGKIALSMLSFVKPALVLYGIGILVFFSNVSDHTQTIGVVAVIYAGAYWVFHTLLSMTSCKWSKRNEENNEPYIEAKKKFSSVLSTQTYENANPYTRYKSFQQEGAGTSEILMNPIWQHFYHTHSHNLPSNPYIFSLVPYGAMNPTAPKAEEYPNSYPESPGYTQVPVHPGNIYPTLDGE